MPDKLKQTAINIIEQKNYKSLQTIKTALGNKSYDEKKWKLFIDFTKQLDIMRNTNITDVVPQLKEYF